VVPRIKFYPVLKNRDGIFHAHYYFPDPNKEKGRKSMSENSLVDVRLEKLEYVNTIANPYPDRFEKTHEISEAVLLADGVGGVFTAGRIMFIRKMGRLSFVSIADINGSIQIAVRKDVIGEEAYEFFQKGFDIGDFLGSEGEMFTTNTGEKTIRAERIVFLGKALRPLPEKFHGVNDVEICYRKDTLTY
jgi:lysyl-tRNA synthetase class 2